MAAIIIVTFLTGLLLGLRLGYLLGKYVVTGTDITDVDKHRVK